MSAWRGIIFPVYKVFEAVLAESKDKEATGADKISLILSSGLLCIQTTLKMLTSLKNHKTLGST